MTRAIEEAKRLFELGLYFFEEEDFSKAEEQFKAALLIAPDRISILVNLSATLIHRRLFYLHNFVVKPSSIPNSFCVARVNSLQ